MPTLGQTLWDSALGRTLYDQHVPYAEIGRRVGTSGSCVKAFAARHWPRRDETQVERAGRRAARRPRPARKLRPGQATLPPLSALRDT